MNIHSILILVLAFYIFVACDNQINSPDDLVFPEKNVSFFEHVQPFLKYYCAYQGCHAPETRAGGKWFSDWESIIHTDNLGFVVSGNPDGSRFVQIIEGKSLSHFSYIRYDIKDNHIQGIRTWILEGARNN